MEVSLLYFLNLVTLETIDSKSLHQLLVFLNLQLQQNCSANIKRFLTKLQVLQNETNLTIVVHFYYPFTIKPLELDLEFV